MAKHTINKMLIDWKQQYCMSGKTLKRLGFNGKKERLTYYNAFFL